MAEKKSILFVDDDLNLLDGLKRMLRVCRNEWNMVFVSSGEEALKLMEQTPVDVIVSDLRMPCMDGAALLAEIRERYPHVSRIVLSGHADKATAMRAIGNAHQYLTKPCSADTLKAAVSRSVQLRDVLGNDELRRLVTGMTAIPSLPSLYLELVSELESAESSLKKVSNVISQDIGMTAKILQLVNSDLFGIADRITNPEQAVTILGLDTIRSLVLSIGVFSQMLEGSPTANASRELWTHSLITGVFARQIGNVENLGRRKGEECFTAGLLHDIGKLVLWMNTPDKYQTILETSRSEKRALWTVEKEVLGCTHADIGAYLLGLWALPDPVVEAVAYHHNPKGSTVKTFSSLSIVHVANYLANRHSAVEYEAQLDRDYMAGIGFLERVDNWELLCKVTAEEGLSQELQSALHR